VEAHAETYYLFVGTDCEPANHVTVSGGRYVDRLERRDGRWAIADRVCVVEWNAESTSLITEEVIAMMAGSMKVARHDRTDPPMTVLWSHRGRTYPRERCYRGSARSLRSQHPRSSNGGR
jgi:hypothetical protein